MRIFQRIINTIIIILIPVILTLVSVRILLTPLFIQVEYQLTGFPEDNYGFTIDERLFWANISREYLLNQEGIEFLSEKNLDETTPLYNERELRHMLDVKKVVRGAMIVLLLSIALLVVMGLLMGWKGKWNTYAQAVSFGGWVTVGLIISILVYLGLNFNSLFTNFHRIFFEGDTWLFHYSDTLIRLFPIQFWRDAFIWIAGIASYIGILLGWFFPKLRK